MEREDGNMAAVARLSLLQGHIPHPPVAESDAFYLHLVKKIMSLNLKILASDSLSLTSLSCCLLLGSFEQFGAAAIW